MIPEQKVKVEWMRTNKKWYEERGYKFTDYGETFEAEVTDLQPSSPKLEIKVICDYCGESYKTTMFKYYRAKAAAFLQTDCCGKKECKSAKVIQSNIKKYGKNSAHKKKIIMVKDKEGNEVEGQECARCNTPKPLTKFWNDPNTSTGKSSWCTDCMKEYRQTGEQKTKREKYQETYYNDNKDSISKRKQDWYKNKKGGV
jgi:hypothetical protein